MHYKEITKTHYYLKKITFSLAFATLPKQTSEIRCSTKQSH